jgi:hypothetical protein
MVTDFVIDYEATQHRAQRIVAAKQLPPSRAAICHADIFDYKRAFFGVPRGLATE